METSIFNYIIENPEWLPVWVIALVAVIRWGIAPFFEWLLSLSKTTSAIARTASEADARSDATVNKALDIMAENTLVQRESTARLNENLVEMRRWLGQNEETLSTIDMTTREHRDAFRQIQLDKRLDRIEAHTQHLPAIRRDSQHIRHTTDKIYKGTVYIYKKVKQDSAHATIQQEKTS